MIGWLFPGQGSQKTGMASEIEAAAPLFNLAAPVIGSDLTRLCTTDSDPTWTPEAVQQSLFVTSAALSSTLAGLGLTPTAVAGHSLGEFAALVAAGSLSFEEGIHLVDVRARAMAAAGRRHPGGMAAVIGLEPATIEEICARQGDVWIANLNSPKQTVVSGKDAPLAAAADACLRAGALRVIKLQVPVPCHCPLMEDAGIELDKALSSVSLQAPGCPVYCCADGSAHTDPGEIARLLVEVMSSPVRFVDLIRAMRTGGVEKFVECGPGKVLRGLVRQIDPEAALVGVATDQEAAEFAASTPTQTTRRTSMTTSQPAMAVQS